MNAYFETLIDSEIRFFFDGIGIYYCFEGNGLSLDGKKEFSLHTNQFVLTCGKGMVMLKADKKYHGPARILRVDFSRNELEKSLSDLESRADFKDLSLFLAIKNNYSLKNILNDDTALNVFHLIFLITHEFNHNTVGSDVICCNTLSSLILITSRIYSYSKNESLNMVTSKADIDYILKYIYQNIAADLSLKTLAEILGYSREHLCRYFKKETNTNLSKYIASQRVKRAISRMDTDEFTISEIAEYAGFSSVSSFERNFKKITGKSPSDYKRNQLSSLKNKR